MVYSMEVRKAAPTGTSAAEVPETASRTLLVSCGDCGAPEGISCAGGQDHPERIQLAYRVGLL